MLQATASGSQTLSAQGIYYECYREELEVGRNHIRQGQDLEPVYVQGRPYRPRSWYTISNMVNSKIQTNGS